MSFGVGASAMEEKHIPAVWLYRTKVNLTRREVRM